MSTNKKPRLNVTNARNIARRLDQQAVLILGIERDGAVSVVVHGESESKQQALQCIVDMLLADVSSRKELRVFNLIDAAWFTRRGINHEDWTAS